MRERQSAFALNLYPFFFLLRFVLSHITRTVILFILFFAIIIANDGGNKIKYAIKTLMQPTIFDRTIFTKENNCSNNKCSLIYRWRRIVVNLKRSDAGTIEWVHIIQTGTHARSHSWATFFCDFVNHTQYRKRCQSEWHAIIQTTENRSSKRESIWFMIGEKIDKP